jgi:hypothetical protein
VRNVALLEATMTHIKDHPETHNQSVYMVKTSCGTTACYAGRAYMLGGGELIQTITPTNAMLVRNSAKAMLGIDEQEAIKLFSPANTLLELELMVKDLCNGERLRPSSAYWRAAYGESVEYE